MHADAGLLDLLRALAPPGSALPGALPHCTPAGEEPLGGVAMTAVAVSSQPCVWAQRLVFAVAALLVGGFGLNMVWAVKIVRMASGGGRRAKPNSKASKQE